MALYNAGYGPSVDSASKRNNYQEYLRIVKGGRWAGLLLPSRADCLEITTASIHGALKACPDL